MDQGFVKTGTLVTRKFREYFFPTLLAQAASQLGVFVDSLILGNMIGSEAMTGVSVCLPLEQTIGATALLFSIGAAGMIAAAIGARQNREADRIYSAVIILNVVTSLIFLAILLPFVKETAAILAGGDQIFAPTYEYLKVMVWRTPFMMLLMSADVLVRSDGKPKLASQAIVLSQIVNIVLDLVFIGPFRLGITGAAIATVTSDVAGILYIILRYLPSKERTLHFVGIDGGIRAFFRRSGELCAAGFAAFMAAVLISVKVWCIYRILGHAGGDDAMKIYAVCMSCLTILSMIVSGCLGAMVPVLGVIYGEKDYGGVRMLARYVVRFTLALTTVLVAGIMIYPEGIFALFNFPAELLGSGCTALRLYSVSLFGVALSFMVMYYYSTVEQAGAATLISLVEGILVVVPASWILVRIVGVNGVWYAFILAELAWVIVLFIYMKIMHAKDSSAYPDIYFIPAPLREIIYDVSLIASRENASALSEGAMKALKERGIDEGIAVKTGIALEEMTVNLITADGKHPGSFDLDVRITENDGHVVIALRDNGQPFNPVEYSPEEKETYLTDGIMVLKALARDVQYNRALSLNQTIIEI